MSAQTKTKPTTRLLRDVSITAKLATIVVVFVAVIAMLLAIMTAAFNISTAVRAYVGAEGLWSKGQKDAVYYLARYARFHTEGDYRKYQQAVASPLGYHVARLELQKQDYNYDVAAKGFVQGGSAPEDARNMVYLFRYFHDVSYLADAIRLWTSGDGYLAQLENCADELHAAIISGNLTGEHETRLLDRIESVNTSVTPLEHDFSATLGMGARWIQGVLLLVIFCAAAVLLCGGLVISWRISRELRTGIFGLRQGAIRVSQGDLEHLIEVRSQDEIGDLARVFNEMIIHRRQAEDQLRSATEFREKIMQSATNAIFAQDLERRFTLVNRRTCEITGYTADELIGNSYQSLFTSASVARVDQQYDMAAQGKGAVSNYETPLVRKDGSSVDIRFSLAPLLKEGKIIGVVGTAEDITERRRAEAALEKEREFLKTMLENLTEGIAACDENGILSVFNPATREFHGLPEAQIPSSEWAEHYDLYLADGVTKMRMEDVPLFRAFHGETIRDFEMVISPKHRPRRTLVCNGQALVTASGKKLGAVIAMYDVTERKRAESELTARAEELQRSNTELEQFAYVASHDLQAPLRGVIGFCQLLQEQYEGKLDENANEYIGIIVKSAMHMRSLIAGLLEFSRVGRAGEEFVQTDLETIIADVESQLSAAIKEQGAEVTHDPLPVVNCVPLEINQLFQNLIGNAIKFQSSRKPRVHVACVREDRHWRFSVRDNGIGIKPEHQQRIFQIFQRLNPAEEYEGTGIGLAICQKIVHAHGGRIWVESEPGQGSTFHFTLKA